MLSTLASVWRVPPALCSSQHHSPSLMLRKRHKKQHARRGYFPTPKRGIVTEASLCWATCHPQNCDWLQHLLSELRAWPGTHQQQLGAVGAPGTCESFNIRGIRGGQKPHVTASTAYVPRPFTNQSSGEGRSKSCRPLPQPMWCLPEGIGYGTSKAVPCLAAAVPPTSRSGKGPIMVPEGGVFIRL